ncbi:branched-chain amino acid transporter permease [Arthrobacter sp. CJ23]|uniref:branched-chain amino acid transporter permease n=1 Tax=Arthrobacter sp. CJ23 TaxID=2972479 RepID=UPI00215CBB7E|nr:AzlD domain-containing protein [Arthrobacter sp. CJ23]UVJ39045.1 AzlD domain-containing protein [Arthrobacter sp. CJ23]
MPEPAYILAAVLISSAVTWTLRAAPFALLAPIRHSALLPYLNENMPVGIMTILVFYTVRHVPPAFTPATAAIAAGFIVTAGLHLWRRNAVVSVLGGTAVHVALASTLPAWL